MVLFCAFTAGAFAQSMLSDANKADAFYKEGKFVQALYIYNNIADNGNNSFDKRIAEIKGKLANDATSSEQFQACIIEGNAAQKNKEYELAYVCFKAALLINPDANFPKTKLKDLAQFVQDPSVEKDFQRIKKAGDDYFNEREYDLANKMYNDALVLKPGDKSVLEKKVEIDNIYSKQTENRRQYDDFVFKGDRFFQNGDYDNAEVNYREALLLFPKESHPKEKLSEIQSISTNNVKREEDYAKAVADGDKAFEKEKYQEAQDFYIAALALKPKEQYPNTKLMAINEILSRLSAKDDEIALIRENIISNIAAEQYNIAMSHIQTGLRINPTDVEFLRQRAQVDSILTKRNLDNTNYDNFVSMADELFKDKNYAEAKRYYNRANDIRHSDELVGKIAQIDALMSTPSQPSTTVAANTEPAKPKAEASPEDKQKYKEAITRGDNKFKRKEYDAAKVEYLDALKYIPNDNYTTGKITEIDTLINRSLRAQAAVYEQEKKAYQAQQAVVAATVNRPPDFAKIVAEAKSFYYRKNYDKALNGFNKALEVDSRDAECEAYKDTIVQMFAGNTARTLAASPASLENGQKKMFNFNKLTPAETKNCYLAIIMTTSEQNSPKVYLNYYQGATKKGGFVIKDLQASGESKEVYVKLSDIVVWQREAIDAIELMPEGGSAMVNKMYIISLPQ